MARTFCSAAQIRRSYSPAVDGRYEAFPVHYQPLVEEQFVIQRRMSPHENVSFDSRISPVRAGIARRRTGANYDAELYSGHSHGIPGLTLTGRDVNASAVLSRTFQAVGTASFDGVGA